MDKVGGLEGQLSDTQNSLAAALARIEGLRIRQHALSQENIHLRNVLRKHGIHPGEDDADSTAVPVLDVPPEPNEQVSSTKSTGPRMQQLGEGEQLAVLLQQVQPHAVVMHTEHGQACSNMLTFGVFVNRNSYSDSSTLTMVHLHEIISISLYVSALPHRRRVSEELVASRNMQPPCQYAVRWRT